MPADKEIFLREYVTTRASEKELRELTLDLLDGVHDLRKNFTSKKLEEDLLLWTERAEFELYRTIRQAEISRRETPTAHSPSPVLHNRLTRRLRISVMWWIIIMSIIFVFASVWSLGVGLVVLVAYVFAFLMSVTDGKQNMSP